MFCSKCGANLADGSKFCPGCGTRVGNILNRQDKDIFEDNSSMIQDDDDVDIDDFFDDDETEEEDDEEYDVDSSDKNEGNRVADDDYTRFINSLAGMRLKIDCVSWESSFNDIINNVGSKLFILAEYSFTNKYYDKAIENFNEYIKINDILISHYRIAQSFIGLALNVKDTDKVAYLNNIDKALNTINTLRPTKNEGKFQLLNLKGNALSLKADYFYFMKKVVSGSGNEEEKSYKDSTLDAIKSYKEALNFATDKLSKPEVWLKIGKLFYEIDSYKEAMEYLNQCISTLEPINDYDTVEGNIVDQSIYYSIYCFFQLKDEKNFIIMLSKYYKIHKDNDEELDENIQKFIKTAIESGYGAYFNGD